MIWKEKSFICIQIHFASDYGSDKMSKVKMMSEKKVQDRYACLIDYAIPTERPKIQPHLIKVDFGGIFAYEMPAARIEDIEIWIHEFVEVTIAWILYKMFGHRNFILSVVNQNIRYRHRVTHLITSLFHVSYMSMGHKRLSPNEYEYTMFGHDTK